MGWLGNVLKDISGAGGGGSPHGGTAPVVGNPGGFSLSGGGGGGGFNLGNPGGFSLSGATGDQAPDAVANTALQKDLGFVQSSGNQGQIQQANAIAGGKTNSRGGIFGALEHVLADPLSKVVEGLDEPRAVVASLAGGADSLLNGQGFNLGQVGHNIATHATTGHILAELEGPKDAQSSAGKWNNRILGIIGDVALDPLTYAGGLGEVGRGLEGGTKAVQAASDAEKAAKGGDAALAASKAAEADKINPISPITGERTITPETIHKLNTGGVAALEDEEKQVLGLKSGIAIGKTGNRAQVLPSGLTDPLSVKLHEMGAAVRERGAMSSFAKHVVPHAAVRQMIGQATKDGDYETAHTLTQVLKATPLATGARQAFLNEHGPALKESLKPFETPEDMGKLRDALEGRETDLNPEHVMGVHDTLEHMRQAANDTGVKIGSVANYFPHQVTDAARKAKLTKNPAKAFSSELKRTLKPGDQLMGHTLEDGSVSEINGILRSEGGQDLFKSETPDVLSTYLHGMAGRVGKQAMANHLENMGVTQAGDLAKAPADWEKMAASGAYKDMNAPPYVKEALDRLDEERQASIKHHPTGLMKKYDAMMNVWRSYQLAMPGKAIRHTVAGPAWAHYLGGVDTKSLKSGFKTWHAYQKGGLDAVKDPEMAKRIEQFQQVGLGHGHAFEDLHNGGAVSANPLSQNFAYHRANREVQARAQDYSRFAMFSHAMDQGASHLTAAGKVRSLMGDPHNLTDSERAVARRVIPFYAFLRTQMPAQLKAVGKTPEKFVDFVNTERNAQEGDTAPGVVPSFYKQTMSMQLPFKIGGNSTYLSPDLPFTRINQLLSGPNQVISQLAPEIQLPLEKAMGGVNASTGAPFSKTAEPLPTVMKPLGPILAALGLASKQGTTTTDFGKTTTAGTYRILPEVEQALDSILPPLGQARRIDTSGEPNLAPREKTTVLSDLLGQNFRTDDPYQQASELYRRDALIKQLIENMQNNGSLPPYLRGFKH